MKLSKQDVTDLIRNKPQMVQFTKKNGTIRDMKCTLDSNIIPPAPEKTEEQLNQPNREGPPGLLSVWDMESEGWRSFYVDSVISIQEA